MTINKPALAVIILTAFAAGMLMPRPYIKALDGAVDPAPFDHSNCQYPERWSNPKDGCDNSDPAVPECIKASYSKESEQACIDAFVKANTPTDNSTNNEAQPVLNVPLTPATSGGCK